MKDKKLDKQKLFSTVVVIILVFFFVGGFWLGLDRVSSMEGTFPPNVIKEGISAAPESIEDANRYFEYLVNYALEEKPAISTDTYFSVDSGSVATDGSDTFRSTLLFALDSFEDHISTVEESDDILTSVSFGEDTASVLEVPTFAGMKVTDFNCSYIYYSCPSCGETSDEQLPSCEPCGSTREYFKKYRDEYEIELILEENPAPGSRLDPIFESRTKDEISALTDSVLKDVAVIDSTDISHNQYKLIFKVNRLTDKITSLRYIKEMSVSADVTFIGKYEEIGNTNISFNVSETKKYDFTWPSVSLNEEKLVIEPKKSDNLLATLTCDDPLAMTVTWTSSDENVATVDSEGYIYTTNNTGEAVITATFEYLGKTYSDSCTVYVRVPVESMKMNKKSVSLSVDEAAALAIKISPSDATVKTVKWYSENEDIATVDENGVVTAKAKGSVIVYALSDDGYFRSTCEVTVE